MTGFIITKFNSRRGFSLAEIIAVLVITSMLVIAVISIYGRVKSVSASISRNIEKDVLPREILQRIAEDLDSLASPGFDTTVTIRNKFDNNFNVSQLIIENRYYDSQTPPVPRIFERVVWQTNYDPFESALILYRAHSGLNLEDKVIDRQLEDLQKTGRELFVPICSGITFFEINAMNNEQLVKQWAGPGLPKAVAVSISFAQPEEMTSGRPEVLDEMKMTRTVAIDRTRKITYKFVKKEFDQILPEPEDPNSISDPNSTSDGIPARPADKESPLNPDKTATPKPKDVIKPNELPKR